MFRIEISKKNINDRPVKFPLEAAMDESYHVLQGKFPKQVK